MRFAVDHYFRIGTGHARAGEPCQDYALSGVLSDGRIYGVVADGCSGAKARTDVGARVIALLLEGCLKETEGLSECFSPEFLEKLLSRLQARPLGGAISDYLASVVAFCADSTTCKVYVAGDGAWAYRSHDGVLSVNEVDWSENMPGYLGYALDFSTQQEFIGHTKNKSTWSQQRYQELPESRSWRLLDERQEVLGAELVLQGRVAEVPMAQVQALAVFSDGVSQLKNVTTVEGAGAALAFKNTTGSFVKRRMLSALAGWEKLQKVPEDDIAVAAMVLQQEAV